jgi:histidyl-tRNA synthetase
VARRSAGRAGRFREFYQCDVDALGSVSPVVEAELCSAVSDVLLELGFRTSSVRLNHRRLLTALLTWPASRGGCTATRSWRSTSWTRLARTA